MWQPKRATKRHTTACSSQNYYKALFNIQLTERKFISGVLELQTVRVETIYHEQATVEDRVWTTRSQTLHWLNGMTKKRYDIGLVNTTLLYSAQLFIRGKNKVLCDGLFFVRISKLKSLWLQNYVAQIHPSHYVKQSSPGIFLASAAPWQMTRWARFTVIARTPSFFLFLFYWLDKLQQHERDAPASTGKNKSVF